MNSFILFGLFLFVSPGVPVAVNFTESEASQSLEETIAEIDNTAVNFTESEASQSLEETIAEIDNTDSLCPSGWSVFANSATALCVYFSDEDDTATFHMATEKCQDMGGYLATQGLNPDSMDFITERVESIGGDFYVALYKDTGYTESFTWLVKGQVSSAPIPEAVDEFPSYKKQCGYYSSYTENWEVDDCGEEYRYVCQKPVECPPGRFGGKCDRECHCFGDVCDSSLSVVTCPKGCQRGWVGEACDIPRKPIQVKYYCVKDDTESGVYIRVFTNGREKITLYQGTMLSSYNIHWQLCKPNQETWQPSGVPGWQTIRVLANTIRYNYRTDLGHWTYSRCRYFRGDNLWKVQVSETPGVILEHDFSVQINCNFTSTMPLSVKSNFSLTDSDVPALRPLTPEYVSDDVSLTLVNAVTDEVITSADLGTPVRLRLTYGLKRGSVIPKCCVAKDSSGQTLSLIDCKGCLVNTSLVPDFTKVSMNQMETKWFPLFRLSEATEMYISCAYDLCFDEEVCQKPDCLSQPRTDNSRYGGRFKRSADQATEGTGLSRIKSQTVQVVQYGSNVPSA